MKVSTVFPSRRGRMGALVALTAAVMLTAGASPAVADSAAATRHSDMSSDLKVVDTNAVTFAGAVTETGPTGPATVPECAQVNCQHFALKVELKPQVWKNQPGGVQVTIVWHQLFNDIAHLVVYRKGTKVGESIADVTSFQSLRLNSADSPHSTPNDMYDVYVAYAGYTDTDNHIDPSPTISYTGWVQVQREIPAQPVRDLLPNLQPLPSPLATFNSPGSIFGDSTDPNYPSCFHSEVVETGVHKCLRLSQRMWNVNGPNTGPVEINFSKPAGQTPDTLPATQRIYRSDGSFYDRSAGTVDFHPVHGHYHYSKYTVSQLFARDANGNPVGAALATGIKNGFCLADTDVVAQPGDLFVAVMTYTAPNCLSPRSVSADGLTEFFAEGEGSGNGDTYDWNLPDQYINADTLVDGTYVVQTVVDPEHKLLEANPHDNCIAMVVQLSGMASNNPQAQLLGPGPACTS
ncbi:MAG TPA: hypothetical protein VLF67_00845 [Candidatus Saccharimonas sp.]|nr:hypothetical protein [Candidatus Saccharimonas sp.]